MEITIEQLLFDELLPYLRRQADEAFPSLKDGRRSRLLAKKWCESARFCTCRDVEGCLIGMIVYYANRPETGIAYISHVYINTGFRGKGLFSRLLLCVKADVMHNGFNQIQLEVQKDNIRAQHVYLKSGFQIGEETDESYYLNCNMNG